MAYKFAGNVFFTVHVIVLSMQNPGNIQFVKKWRNPKISDIVN